MFKSGLLRQSHSGRSFRFLHYTVTEEEKVPNMASTIPIRIRQAKLIFHNHVKGSFPSSEELAEILAEASELQPVEIEAILNQILGESEIMVFSAIVATRFGVVQQTALQHVRKLCSFRCPRCGSRREMAQFLSNDGELRTHCCLCPGALYVSEIPQKIY